MRPRPVRKFMTTVAIAAAAVAISLPMAASAEPRVWDIENYDECMATILAQYQAGKITFQQFNDYAQTCCNVTGGVWSASQETCVAPPADAQDSRQLPGNVRVPSDISSAQVATPAPPRPIVVPPDLANTPAMPLAPDCPPDTACQEPPVP